VYNIQKAVSRLDYAPKLKEIEITDIKKGLGVFTPKPDKAVSFAALKATLKSAGYVLDSADITVAGTLSKEGNAWIVTAKPSGQKFVLIGENVANAVAGLEDGSAIEIAGGWKTEGEGTNAREVIAPAEKKQALRDTQTNFCFAQLVTTNFVSNDASADIGTETPDPAAPIRVTSPGLTVYKGGAITPRVYLVRQSLGSLKVNRQIPFEVAAISISPSGLSKWVQRMVSPRPPSRHADGVMPSLSLASE